jgi:hypothetical protein
MAASGSGKLAIELLVGPLKLGDLDSPAGALPLTLLVAVATLETLSNKAFFPAW